jgi:hypothetical protein
MSEKHLGSALATSLVPLGAAALAAGCGGGGSAVAPVHPNTTMATGPTGPTVTAQLRITIPARGVAAGTRKPKYISQGSGAIAVTVAGGSPQIFTLPSPGPSPVTTTLPIQAVVGNDTIAVNVYDVSPSATASPNLLSTGTIQTTIAPTALNTQTVTTLGVPAGVVLALANNRSPAPSATVRPWTPLENASGPQSVTVNATAIDALGYTINGALATAAPITVTGPVTLSAPSLANATGTVTATYPTGANIAGTIGSSLPLTSGTIAVAPDYGVFVAATTDLVAIDGIDRTSTTFTVGANVATIAASACGGGAVAIAPTNAGKVEIATLAPSTAAAPVPAPSVTSLTVSGVINTSPVTFDAACNAYVAAPVGPTNNPTSWNLYRLSGFGGTVSASSPTSIGALSGLAGQTANLSYAAGTLYFGEGGAAVGSPPVGQTFTLTTPSGTPSLLDANLGESVVTAGTTVYKIWNVSSLPCAFVGPDLQDLQGAGSLLAGTANSVNNSIAPMIAAHDGTIYDFWPAIPVAAAYSVSTPLSGASSWSTLNNILIPAAIALSPDPSNTYFCDANTTQVSFYLRAQLGSVQTPANVTLPLTATGIATGP